MRIHATYHNNQIDGLGSDCSNSTVNALELLQSCSKPSISGPEQNGKLAGIRERHKQEQAARMTLGGALFVIMTTSSNAF